MTAARLTGGYGELAKRALLATFPTVLAFMCPFVWAFVVYQILRSTESNQTSFKELLSAPPGNVVIDDDVVTFESEDLLQPQQVVPRSEILDGWIEEAGASTLVHLRLTRRRRFLLQLNREDDAEQILRDLGIGPDKQTVRFVIVSSAVENRQGAVYHLLGPWIGLPVILLAVVALSMAVHDGDNLLIGAAIGTLVALALICVRFVRSIRRRTLVVGRDGFAIAGRFVSFTEVKHVQHITRDSGAYHDSVEVDLVDDTSIDLRCGSFAVDDTEAVGALYRRIRNAHAAFHAVDLDDAGGVALLERHGRSIDDWKAELSRLVTEGSDYRAARLNAVHLAEVVEDATATVERRLGAAIALSSLEEKPALQQRMRIAANACANPKLRIALERAYDGELEAAELEAALARTS